MKAIRLHRHGTPDVMVLEDVPEPAPGAGQVLLRVESAGVNYADVMRRRNDPYPFPTVLPFTPGGEVAGTVAALGEGVDGPPVGTPVFALVGDDGANGYAQYAVAAAAQVIPITAGLGVDEAAAIVVAGSTAMLLLTEAARLAPGESILVQGAAGGVGGYVVQLATLFGAGQVIAAASTPAKREAALALGADAVVDYTRAGWPQRVRELTGGLGADIVLETSGGEVGAQSLQALAPFGRLIVQGAASGRPLTLQPATVRGLFYDPAPNQSLTAFNVGLWFGLRPQAAVAALGRLLGHVGSGEVKVQIDRTLPLSQAAAAHRLLEAREVIGKIVLKPWED